MGNLKQEFKEEYEKNARKKIVETIISLKSFIKDKEFDNKEFDKKWFNSYLDKMISQEENMTIDKLARWSGFAIAYLNFSTKERFKLSEITISKPQKDCSFINTFGHFVDKFFNIGEVPSAAYDCKIIEVNKIIINRLKNKINEADDLETPFDKQYLLKLSRLLSIPKNYSITMINHSLFLGYLQGATILNDLTTIKNERDFSRGLYQGIYLSFDINQVKITV